MNPRQRVPPLEVRYAGENAHERYFPKMTAATSAWSYAFPHRDGKCQLSAI
jgi:hypothetical protein